MESLYAQYESVKRARATLQKQEDDIREKLLLAAGYTSDDPKPPDAAVQDYDGNAMYQVQVSYRRDLDKKYLKAKHPEIYAECEKSIPVKQIKAPDVQKRPRLFSMLGVPSRVTDCDWCVNCGAPRPGYIDPKQKGLSSESGDQGTVDYRSA